MFAHKSITTTDSSLIHDTNRSGLPSSSKKQYSLTPSNAQKNSDITKAEIEAIRGVSSDASIYKLLEYGLIDKVI